MLEVGVKGSQKSSPLEVALELPCASSCLMWWEAVLLDECEVSLALAKACSMRSCIGNIFDLNDGVAWLWLSGLLAVNITRWARRGLWSDGGHSGLWGGGGHSSSCRILLLASQPALQAGDEIMVARCLLLLMLDGPRLMFQSSSP